MAVLPTSLAQLVAKVNPSLNHAAPANTPHLGQSLQGVLAPRRAPNVSAMLAVPADSVIAGRSVPGVLAPKRSPVLNAMRDLLQQSHEGRFKDIYNLAKGSDDPEVMRYAMTLLSPEPKATNLVRSLGLMKTIRELGETGTDESMRQMWDLLSNAVDVPDWNTMIGRAIDLSGDHQTPYTTYQLLDYAQKWRGFDETLISKVAMALAKHDGTPATNTLLWYLKGNLLSLDQKEAVIRTIQSSGLSRQVVADRLRRVGVEAYSPEVAFKALEALGQHSSDEALDAIVRITFPQDFSWRSKFLRTMLLNAFKILGPMQKENPLATSTIVELKTRYHHHGLLNRFDSAINQAYMEAATHS
jgi:hypothetical protein